MDETYIKIKGKWKYLYRAVDSTGNTLEFMLSVIARWQDSDTLFPQSAQGSAHPSPRVITVDKNAAYSVAIEALKADKTITGKTQLRQSKYLNNVLNRIAEPSSESQDQ